MNETAITIQHFKKSFGNKVVHRDINLEVRRGECLGLLGGSGAGKSVILRSLIGLEKPDAGEIYIENEPVVGLDEEHLVPIRKNVAYVFQGGALFDSQSVFDNLAYPLREHTKMTNEEIKARIAELLNEFGLAGNENTMPSELSGGMQKRVGLARAIILGPRIILYDEPTAGLDPYNTHKIQEMIMRLKAKGTTSILVTHDMPTAFAVCDRVALIVEGKISAVSAIKDIANSPDSALVRFVQGKES